jgi:hypothetical protein
MRGLAQPTLVVGHRCGVQPPPLPKRRQRTRRVDVRMVAATNRDFRTRSRATVSGRTCTKVSACSRFICRRCANGSKISLRSSRTLSSARIGVPAAVVTAVSRRSCGGTRGLGISVSCKCRRKVGHPVTRRASTPRPCVAGGHVRHGGAPLRRAGRRRTRYCHRSRIPPTRAPESVCGALRSGVEDLRPRWRRRASRDEANQAGIADEPLRIERPRDHRAPLPE